MQILTLCNHKGGVGKTAIACQFALYLKNNEHKKVLFIDLDAQLNATNTLLEGKEFAPFEQDIYEYLGQEHTPPALINFNNENDCYLIKGSLELNVMESNTSEHSHYIERFGKIVEALASQFDVCIIDTSPAADIRLMAALAASTFALVPIELAQESVDGLSHIMKFISWIKENINPKLQLLGALPNRAEKKPYQIQMLLDVHKAFPGVILKNDKLEPLVIYQSTAFAQAQAEGIALASGKTTTFRTAWRANSHVFAHIYSKILPNDLAVNTLNSNKEM
jgi:chromosome partitioning protein